MLEKLKSKVLEGGVLTSSEAEELYLNSALGIDELLSSASLVTKKFRPACVNLCAITNARSGLCAEDCIFCAQSVTHQTGVMAYPLISVNEMLKRAEEAVLAKTNRFCIVTSGRGVSENELEVICDGLLKIRSKFEFLKLDASLGILSMAQVDRLKEAGLNRYNHNLETARSFFSKICTTHNYDDRLKTIRLIKEAGIEICCGGIIGLGEEHSQRLELAFALKELDVDSIPLNFLNPIPNTPLENVKPLSPVEILRVIALFRFINPTKEIRICGGRQSNLRSLQALIFMAGADAIIIGNYLTTRGSAPSDDIAMIHDLGLKIADPG